MICCTFLHCVAVVVAATLTLAMPDRSRIRSSTASQCPRDPAIATRHCLDEHRARMTAIRRSETHFLGGVDVENIRSLCHQFQQSMNCIRYIRDACPAWQHDAMEQEIRPYVPVFNMCSQHHFIEDYAIVQNCLLTQRDTTDVCYRQFTLSADSYEHHARQNHRSALRSYCQYMRQLSACVEGNIRPWCGEVAAQLTRLLVNVSADLSYKCHHHHHHNHHHATDDTTKLSNSYYSGGNSGNMHVAETQRAHSSTVQHQSSVWISFVIAALVLMATSLISATSYDYRSTNVHLTVQLL